MNVSQNIKIKWSLIGVFFLLNSLHINADTIPSHWHSPLKVFCDLCGCSSSGGSSGFGTLGNTSFLGLRYVFQDYKSRDGIFNNSPTSHERFNTYQVWGRIPLTEKISINAIMPYQDLYREFEDRTEHINGLGDITLLGWYQLKFFKKKKENDKVDFNMKKEPSGHQLNFGLGFKLPTGEFEEKLTDRINPGFQVGTGSLDAVLSIMHIYSKERIGINTSATYYFKTENKNDYKFGNQLSLSSNAYYNVPFKKSALSPFLGLSADVYDAIKQFNETILDTRGHIVNGTLGSEFMMNKFIIGANYTFPIKQELFGNNVTSKNRVTLYLNYAL